MAFSEEELKKWEPIIASFISEQRPRKEIRSQVDLDYSIDIENQSIEIFEIRPQFVTNKKIEVPIAKTTYVRRPKAWKVYWQQSDMKWHKYDPLPKVKTLGQFIEEVKEDPKACFWG